MAIQGSAFIIRNRLVRHGDLLAVLVIATSLLGSGYLVAAREFTETTVTVAETAPVKSQKMANVPGAPAQGAPLNLNRATAADLESLPKIGPALASRIIDHRLSHGGFRSVDELDAVSGIGPATLEALRPLVTAP